LSKKIFECANASLFPKIVLADQENVLVLIFAISYTVIHKICNKTYYVPYNWNIWLSFYFGGLADFICVTKLKSHHFIN